METEDEAISIRPACPAAPETEPQLQTRKHRATEGKGGACRKTWKCEASSLTPPADTPKGAPPAPPRAPEQAHPLPVNRGYPGVLLGMHSKAVVGLRLLAAFVVVLRPFYRVREGLLGSSSCPFDLSNLGLVLWLNGIHRVGFTPPMLYFQKTSSLWRCVLCYWKPSRVVDGMVYRRY